MRKLAAIAALTLVPCLAQGQVAPLAQGQVAPGNACSASWQELYEWAQTVGSQAELDEIIAELQACPGLNVLTINERIRAVFLGASANLNVVIAELPEIQLPLPAAVENLFNTSSSSPRRTASASS